MKQIFLFSQELFLNFTDGLCIVGSEVAQYSANHLPDMLKANNSWFSGNYAKAIQDTFLELDELLRL